MEKTIKKNLKDNSTIVEEFSDNLCKRFVLAGAESTGKTTLAAELAKYFQNLGGIFSSTKWVPEYGREYTLKKLSTAQDLAKRNNCPIPEMASLEWSEKDFLNIAFKQNQIEDQAANFSALIICDTDSFATAIWHERYLNSWSADLEKIIADLPKRTLYLLADHADVPFESDEIRDGEHIRSWMTQRFEEELTKRNIPYLKLQGTRETRLNTSINIIKNYF